MARNKIEPSAMVLVGAFASMILYVAASLFEGGEANLANLQPGMAFTVLSILIVGVAVYFATGLVSKIQKASLSTKDFYSIAVVTVILYLMWRYVFPQTGILDHLTSGAMSMLGLG